MAVTVDHAFTCAIPDDPTDLAAGKVCQQAHWNAAHTVAGALDASLNLSDVANAATARTNLGLGTAAESAATDFVAVAGDTMTGTLVIPQHPVNLSLTTDETYRFNWSSLSYDFGTYYDNTMQLGYNCSGGTRENTADVAWYLQWESKFLSGANYICEWHLNYIGTDGTQRRLFQGEVDRGTHEAGFGITANSFYIHNDANAQLFDVNSTGHVGINYPGMTCTLEVKAVDTNLPALRLHPHSSMGVGEVIFDVEDATVSQTFAILGGTDFWGNVLVRAPSGQNSGASVGIRSGDASKQLKLGMDGFGNAVIDTSGPQYFDFVSDLHFRKKSDYVDRLTYTGSSSIFAVSGSATCSAAVTAYNGTAIPAGGTAGAGLKVSSTANFGVFFGSGAPSLSAAKGSLYLRSDGSGTNDRMYVNTDGGTT